MNNKNIVITRLYSRNNPNIIDYFGLRPRNDGGKQLRAKCKVYLKIEFVNMESLATTRQTLG